ncbi:ABC transporter permease [Spirosoma telluris]|uniref:ABC transporter permease n=1 Tax=Spirosoma telluris TaxID=2183553 RepID=UPI002FC2F5B6
MYSDRDGELSPNNNIEYIYLFLAIALFILLIAVFNFINLTTARSAKRAREVGVRKVAGSSRTELVFQFLSESLLSTFFALLVGIGLAYFLLPIVNTLAAKSLSFSQVTKASSILYLLVGSGVVGLLAGLYPRYTSLRLNPLQP